MVARDGYPQHSTLLSIPLTDVYLDPRLDLRFFFKGPRMSEPARLDSFVPQPVKARWTLESRFGR